MSFHTYVACYGTPAHPKDGERMTLIQRRHETVEARYRVTRCWVFDTVTDMLNHVYEGGEQVTIWPGFVNEFSKPSSPFLMALRYEGAFTNFGKEGVKAPCPQCNEWMPVGDESLEERCCDDCAKQERAALPCDCAWADANGDGHNRGCPRAGIPDPVGTKERPVNKGPRKIRKK